MSMLEKYKWFQKGIVKAGTTERMQQLFKTKITEEQIMILSEIEKMNNILWLFGLILYFILGIAIGWMIWGVLPKYVASILAGV